MGTYLMFVLCFVLLIHITDGYEAYGPFLVTTCLDTTSSDSLFSQICTGQEALNREHWSLVARTAVALSSVYRDLSTATAG